MRKILLLSLLVLGAVFAFGQGSTTSRISGFVKDSNGEALIGATIKAVHTPSGSVYGNITDVNGFFRVPNMRVGGPYTITVTYVGYEDKVRTNVYLTLGQTQTLNFQLSESATQLEEVVVTAGDGTIIDGNVTGATTKISKENINTLPTVGRDLSDFTRLTPQAFVDNADDDGPALSVAGQSNRYNAIFIDGAVNNDVFGLSAQGTNGGQTGVSPISLDAIEQVQVNIAPYDVTQGGFTGAGVNAVTRSGTNDFEGSTYYFVRNESLAGKTPTTLADEREKLPDFSAKTWGARVGGPIIKDKLFFFINTELQDNETPQPFDINTIGDAAAVTTVQNQINQIQTFLRDNYGYETGDFSNNASSLRSTKIIGKIDFNLNENHKLSFRHSYVDAENVDGFVSTANRIRFANESEVFPSTTNSSALEWSANFGNTASNKLILGYTTVKDDRGFAGNPFPQVDIENGTTDFRFGSEPFSTANILEQDVFTFTNNFNLYQGKHTITIGTHNEFYDFRNLFIAQNFGDYTYSSLDDFLNQEAPLFYGRSFSLVDGVTGDASNSAAVFSASQFGFYVQDEFQVNDNLKITGGLRIDVPIINDDPAFDAGTIDQTISDIEQVWDLNGASPGQVPDAQIYWAPRVGFNWDVKGDADLQIRGGLGVFTGRVPFVWAGGPFNNNGTNVGRLESEPGGGDGLLPDGSPIPLRTGDNPLTAADFGVDPNDQIPNGRLEIFEADFKYPQVFRSSLAADKRLAGGYIVTLEGIYTKNINNINHRNVSRTINDFTLQGIVDRRNIENGDSRIDGRYTDVIVVENTDEGYAYNLTAQIQKPFSNGLTASLAYTFGESFGVNDGTSSQLTSNWGRIEHSGSGLNNLGSTRSDFDPGHRINGFVSYQKEYARNFKTTVSLFANAQSGRVFSYVIDQSRGVFDNGSRDNALVYIPRSASEINLVDWDNDGVIVTAAEQWAALDAYIESDPYLSDNRGSYAERNGARSPFEFTTDFRIMQDFYVSTGNGNRNTIQVSLDIFNFTNFLNKNWGKVYNVGGSVDLYRISNGRDIDGATAPEYQFRRPFLGDNFDDADAFFDSTVRDSGINSARWQMQFGVRYIFGG